jgi:uncharacterized YigZ family protein
MASFLTVSAPSEGLYKEKGSRFLAYAFPVSSEDDVKACLAGVKKDHPKARHICYAYRLGAEGAVYKSSDAGEPHHSAGMPILGQIKSFGLTNTLVVVVRYFGGTRLGLGGLTSAYKEAAGDALKHAVIVPGREEETVILEASFMHLNELMNFVKQNNVRILKQDLAESCRISIVIAKENAPAFRAGILQLPTITIV